MLIDGCSWAGCVFQDFQFGSMVEQTPGNDQGFLAVFFGELKTKHTESSSNELRVSCKSTTHGASPHTPPTYPLHSSNPM